MSKTLIFATWIGEKMQKDSWFKYRDGKWCVHMKGHLTTEELYNIFLEEINQKNMNRILKIKITLLAVLFTAIGCKPKPEFYINGKPFYTVSRCVNSKTEMKWEYHYGYNLLTGKYEAHYGPTTKTKCLKSIIDTVEIK